jgi:non-specific serine/threonine protein kinase/serine/threonine-protein kinase
MRPELWPRVTDLMHRALDVPEAELRRWLDAEAAGDAEVAAEVVRLLHAHDRAGLFLESPLIADPGAAAAVEASLPAASTGGLAAGTELGHYRILGEIGRGGMGAVYLGRRSDEVFEKQVAIKVVPGALASDALRERFARERQLLAGLDHPGIARVLDGGSTPAGLQYLVMEYVDGTTIDAYCDQRRLEVRARLWLFVEVCRAVQYAHDHLIVHRDIKASNVLVTADGHPKLLDFGIAKLLAPDERQPDPGATLVQAWTPESASPEQVRGEPTTVATDVYGLGALLFQLLAGRPVFVLEGRDAVERARLICEAPPERPSVAAKAAGRSASQTIAGDLDAIALKALHKEPGRRYRSAEHLAEDVERHLANRPVLAAPDSWRYRARKLVARHPIAITASLAAVMAVLTAATIAVWQAYRAEEERDRAQARLADVRRMANTLIFDVYDQVENSQNATPIRRGLVEKGLAYLDGLGADAASDPTLSLELAEAYRRLAAVQGAGGRSNLGDREGAKASLEKARALLAPLRTGPDVSVEVERADLRLVWRLADLAEPASAEEARRLSQEAVDRSTRLLARFPEREDVLETLGHSYFFAALVDSTETRLDQFTKAGEIYARLVERRPEQPDQLRNLALTEKYLGTIHQVAGRLDLARASYEKAIALDRRVQTLRPDSRQTTIDLAIDLGNLAQILRAEEPPDMAGAAALYRESLVLRERAVAQDPQDVFARQSLGFCLLQLSALTHQLGDLDAALSHGRRAVEIYESLAPSEYVARRGMAWLELGHAQQQADLATEGCRSIRRAAGYLKAAEAVPLERSQLGQGTMESLAQALAGCS